jgi:hypothetical protein
MNSVPVKGCHQHLLFACAGTYPALPLALSSRYASVTELLSWADCDCTCSLKYPDEGYSQGSGERVNTGKHEVDARTGLSFNEIIFQETPSSTGHGKILS